MKLLTLILFFSFPLFAPPINKQDQQANDLLVIYRNNPQQFSLRLMHNEIESLPLPSNKGEKRAALKELLFAITFLHPDDSNMHQRILEAANLIRGEAYTKAFNVLSRTT